MAIIKLKNTLETNLFIDSLSKNVAPGGQISLPDSVVESDTHIAQCIGTGVLEEIKSEPEPKTEPKSELEPEYKPELEYDSQKESSKKIAKPQEESKNVPQQIDDSENDAIVATGDKKTKRVKSMKSSDIPLPDWLDQEQLRKSEAAAHAFDEQEGISEEWKITDEGIEKKRGSKTELVSKDGVTVRNGTDPSDAMPKPNKVSTVKRTDDGEGDPMVDKNADEDYSKAFVDDSGQSPDPGYGTAFIDKS